MADVHRSQSSSQWNEDQFRLMQSYSDHLEDHDTERDPNGRLLSAAVVQDVSRRERERDEAAEWARRACVYPIRAMLHYRADCV